MIGPRNARLSTTKREQLYDVARGDADYPTCKLCALPIMPGQKWDVNHSAHKPKWLGGEIDGLSHRRCNRLHNNRHDTPLFHKNNRLRQKHIGASVRKSRPMVGTIDSGIKLRVGGGRPLDRRTGREL